MPLLKFLSLALIGLLLALLVRLPAGGDEGTSQPPVTAGVAGR